jgi:membrane associated rhomboid family serine protease
MAQHNPQTLAQGGFRLEITRAGWWLVGIYGLLWLVLYGFTHWTPGEMSEVVVTRMLGPAGFEVSTSTRFEMWEILVLQPIGAASTGDSPGFLPFQLLTAPLIYPPPAFSSLLIGCLGFMFFAAPVERLLGLRGFLALWAVSCAGAVTSGLLVGLAIGAPVHFGFAPAVLAVMLVHCMMTPEAQVPFFIVLPVKMKWVALGIVAVVVVRTLGLTGGGVGGGYELGGMAAGYFWWRSGAELDPRSWLRRRRARRNLRLAVDRAIQPADEEDDEPIFH